MTRSGPSGNKSDPFALLFDPPSPTGKSKAIFTTSKPDALATSGPGHGKSNSQSSISSNPTSALSSDSEFGSFVSVTAFDHPLQSPISPTHLPQPRTSSRIASRDVGQSANFFSQFTGEAKERTEISGRKVLDELLAHNNDPLHSVSGFDVSSFSEDSRPGVDEASASASQTESLIDFSDEDYFSVPFTSDSPVENEQSGPTHTRTPRSTPLASSPTSTSFTPTYPQSPRAIQTLSTSPRSSSPIPIPTPSSPSTSPSLSRSWMSTLRLNRSSRPSIPRASTSASLAEETHTILSQPDHSHSWLWDKTIYDTRNPPSLTPVLASPSSSRSHSHSRTPIPGFDHSSISHSTSSTDAQLHGRNTLLSSVGSTLYTASLPPSTNSTITHGTPFASHTFLPPSGAPGFTGDRNWNERGFDFDKKSAEKQESRVELKGRKEFTDPVLSARLAGQVSQPNSLWVSTRRVLSSVCYQVRPYLPALSRLPSSWKLLYSLDQHGISLNTLYTNCVDYEGGVLVAMQDSLGALFGVWLGEGLRVSKGAYYGSGDS